MDCISYEWYFYIQMSLDPYDHHVNKVLLWSSTCGFNIGRDCLKPNGLRVPTLLVKILKLDTVKPHNLKACMKNDILTSNLDTFNRMVYVWRFVSPFFNNRPKSTSIVQTLGIELFIHMIRVKIEEQLWMNFSTITWAEIFKT